MAARERREGLLLVIDENGLNERWRHAHCHRFWQVVSGRYPGLLVHRNRLF